MPSRASLRSGARLLLLLGFGSACSSKPEAPTPRERVIEFHANLSGDPAAALATLCADSRAQLASHAARLGGGAPEEQLRALARERGAAPVVITAVKEEAAGSRVSLQVGLHTQSLLVRTDQDGGCIDLFH